MAIWKVRFPEWAVVVVRAPDSATACLLAANAAAPGEESHLAMTCERLDTIDQPGVVLIDHSEGEG